MNFFSFSALLILSYVTEKKQFFKKTSYSLSLKSYPAPRTEMSPFVASRKYLHLCEFYKLGKVKNEMI